MWKLIILTVCLCLFLSGSAVNARNSTVDRDSIGGAAIQNGFPNVFRSIGNVMQMLFGKKRKLAVCPTGNNYDLLALSRATVVADCVNEAKRCSDDQETKIYIVASEPIGDGLNSIYDVSGGKIIGQGNKVVWDLSGEKLGTYTVTVRFNNSDDVCIITATRTVTVALCSEYEEKAER